MIAKCNNITDELRVYAHVDIDKSGYLMNAIKFVMARYRKEGNHVISKLEGFQNTGGTQRYML